ncbi:uncharacterized protein LOC131950493 isoform X2 [Physella acuta]|uniref:uncharacterized protein LOC131950493 isoform X2 n=1 Tax=Physella acuta TaxID=109671 RepID=UPI0027DCF0A6|nr:uncharacterized protein LOC131950493 isoform X2 [Physella acuta]
MADTEHEAIKNIEQQKTNVDTKSKTNFKENEDIITIDLDVFSDSGEDNSPTSQTQHHPDDNVQCHNSETATAESQSQAKRMKTEVLKSSKNDNTIKQSFSAAFNPKNLPEDTNDSSEKIALHIIDLDNYVEDSKAMSKSEPEDKARLDNFTDMDSNNNVFVSPLSVTSLDKKGDFLSQKLLQIKEEQNFDCGPDYDTQPVSGDISSSGLKAQQTLSALDEVFGNDHYENIEFSTIFSSLDEYHQSCEDAGVYSADSHAHDSSNIETYSFSITDLDNQNFKPFESDSGMFDSNHSLPMPNQNLYAVQINDQHPQSGRLADCEVGVKSQVVMKTEKVETSGLESCTFSNIQPSLAEDSYQFTNAWQPTVPSQSTMQVYRKTPPITATPNPTTCHYADGFPDTANRDAVFYDCCAYDHCGQYAHHDNYYFQNAPGIMPNTYSDWSQVSPSTSVHDAATSQLRHGMDATFWPGPSNRNDMAAPELDQILQIETNEEDEETDDADECLEICDFDDEEFYDSPLRLCAQKTQSLKPAADAVTQVRTMTLGYFSDDSSQATTCSPSTLTPPPSASSTPIPQVVPEGQMLEDMRFYNPWPVSLSYVNPSNIPSTSAFPHCTLSSELLETTLLTHGLQQSMRRPFPSMADAMHSGRFSGKSMFNKKCSTDINLVPRRCGRPRKVQIQSDKITTSTSKNPRSRQKMKNRSEETGHQALDQDSVDDGDETGCSGEGQRVIRHNEPLNQLAINIMSQWFDEHVQNPYPSKADKEDMAKRGGITENQVKSWFANKRNRTNNTKPKVQKRAMEEKLRELFRNLEHNHRNPQADNTRIIQQLSGIIQTCHLKKME